MTDERIKPYLKDRLKRLEDLKNEKRWTTAELGDMVCCKQTLDFIDLLQEAPVSEDLEEELNKYIKDNFTIDKEQLDKFGIEEKDYMYSMDKSDMLALVEYFINWHKTKEEPVSDDLEEAAMMHFKNVMEYEAKTGLKPAYMTSFKAGAKWQKEEMMEKVIGWIEEINNHHYIMCYSDSCEPPIGELIERFKNYMKEGSKDE